MSSKDLLFRVECYVGLRHALGYVVRSEEKLLKDFVRFIGAQAITGPIRAQMALTGPVHFLRDAELRDKLID